MSNTTRYQSIINTLARHALYAAAALPDAHPQRKIIRHQLGRLHTELVEQGETSQAQKLQRMLEWFDTGAIPSTERVVLSKQVSR